MPYETLLLDQTGPVLKVTVNRPEVHNALSRIMRDELDEALQNACDDDSIRVIIIAGAGDNFSSGNDLGSPQDLADQKRRPFPSTPQGSYERQWELNLGTALRWRDLSKVTIAQVQGYCIMGGLMLATVCDLIIASEDAKFCDREVRQGGPHIAYASLPWEIGPRKAKEYLFTGDWITAVEAQRLGLVNRVVPRKDLDGETMALAQRIALQDPFALRLSKMSVNTMMDEMGFRNSILSSFHVYTTFNVAHRQMVTEGRKKPTGIAAARGRDEPFGDRG